MTQAAGDMDYTGEERLVCGADYAPEGCRTELEFIARQGGASPEEAEGAWIARRIRQLVEGGFTVTDKEGSGPPPTGTSACLRSANQYAHAYAPRAPGPRAACPGQRGGRLFPGGGDRRPSSPCCG